MPRLLLLRLGDTNPDWNPGDVQRRYVSHVSYCLLNLTLSESKIKVTWHRQVPGRRDATWQMVHQRLDQTSCMSLSFWQLHEVWSDRKWIFLAWNCLAICSLDLDSPPTVIEIPEAIHETFTAVGVAHQETVFRRKCVRFVWDFEASIVWGWGGDKLVAKLTRIRKEAEEIFKMFGSVKRLETRTFLCRARAFTARFCGAFARNKLFRNRSTFLSISLVQRDSSGQHLQMVVLYQLRISV